MKNQIMTTLQSLALATALVGVSAQAVVITSFDPGVVYNANTSVMDANIGITGHTIEDFEDTSYVSGLSVTAADPITSISSSHPNSVWDDSNMLLTNPNTLGFGAVTFEITAGTTSFGIGIGDVESNLEYFVNGVSRGLINNLTNWNRTQDNAREVYLLLQADLSDPVINTVSFSTTIADAIFFDHLAFSEASSSSSVPVGGTLGLAALGLAAFRLRRTSTKACDL